MTAPTLKSSSTDAVLLDLDGTLLDTIPDLAHAANAMRTDLGLAPLPQSLIATFVGRGVDNLIQRTLAHDLNGADIPGELLVRARASFAPHYHQVNGQKSVLFSGVLPGLQRMQRMGLKMAVVTNKASEFTLPLLARTGLATFMQAVVCGDTLAERKPHPAPMLHACSLLGVNPDRSVVVGDSKHDAASGLAAGCRVLLVPYGYNEGHSVQTLEVDAIVETIEAAAQWISTH